MVYVTDEVPEDRRSPNEEPELQPLEYRGLSRVASIPPCTLSVDDLRRLYGELARKSQEALERQLERFQRPPDKSEEEFEALKEKARQVGGLTVAVQGTRGEQVVATSDEALMDTSLPDSIASVTFDSALAMQTQNVNISDKFRLHLDFTEPPSFQEYNPWDSPTPNQSVLEVSGPNETWVTGVYEWVLDFFRHRKRPWKWLHEPTTFSLLHWFVGFPIGLWLAFRVDSLWLQNIEVLHGALRGAADVYVFLVSVILFRGLVGGFRWLFPLVELEGSRARGVRLSGTVLLTGVLSMVIYDILRALL